VRSFALLMDDFSHTAWNRPGGQKAYGTGGGAAGTARAALLNVCCRAPAPDVNRA
jgi:hypothetical protein